MRFEKYFGIFPLFRFVFCNQCRRFFLQLQPTGDILYFLRKGIFLKNGTRVTHTRRGQVKISVITVTLNHLEGLEATFRSVAAQSFRDFEWVVIDGGSTDGSAEFLQAHKKEIADFVSEPDSGIYQAMNKGVARARGEYCIFMNAGDVFYDERVFEDMAPYLDGTTPMVFGETVYPNGWVHKAIPDVKMRFFWGTSFPHQAGFVMRKVFEENGGYREEYRCASDLFFFFEMNMVRHMPYRSVARKVCRFEGGGIASGKVGPRERRHYILHHMPLRYGWYCGMLELYEMVRMRFFPNFSFTRMMKF